MSVDFTVLSGSVIGRHFGRRGNPTIRGIVIGCGESGGWGEGCWGALSGGFPGRRGDVTGCMLCVAVRWVGGL